jgi:hypothetical protein
MSAGVKVMKLINLIQQDVQSCGSVGVSIQAFKQATSTLPFLKKTKCGRISTGDFFNKFCPFFSTKSSDLLPLQS